MKPLRVLSTSVLFCLLVCVCSAQPAETQARRSPAFARASYWAFVGQFVDKTAHLAYAQRMKDLYGADFSQKQQEEYSVVVAQYSDYLNRLRKSELVNSELFWDDAKIYAQRMIIGPGVPVPERPSVAYSLHTGSPDEDRALYAAVTGQIDVARATISRRVLARKR